MNKEAVISFLNVKLEEMDEDGDLRIFSPIVFNSQNAFEASVHFNSEERHDNVLIWCSNDYLGMSRNKEVIEAGILNNSGMDG